MNNIYSYVLYPSVQQDYYTTATPRATNPANIIHRFSTMKAKRLEMKLITSRLRLNSVL